MLFFWGGTLNVSYIFVGDLGGPQNVTWTLGTSSKWMVSLGEGGGVKNEMRDLAGGSLHFCSFCTNYSTTCLWVWFCASKNVTYIFGDFLRNVILHF